ncbi:hypothetical protein CPLU01_09484 [Colletotrichum plurivorum]|uniref:DUF6604 domain-containing protein n=1 Tax=Colletotrichum plurivorum TaxID=2175906 RepID=A0A8H6NBU2_9PEZI|nr:hypothetical protein CPLU01_09484 [Colletotrichum plurivorum]
MPTPMCLTLGWGLSEVPIATRDSYVGYKQDTQRLVEWMWKTAKLILKTRSADEGGSDLPRGVSPSGETNVAGLVSMASLIADHGAPVSSSIYKLLMSIIRVRSSHDAAFMDYASIFPDQEIGKSNSTHRHFIDTSSTLHRHFIDISSTLHRHFIDTSSTLHRHFIDTSSTL